MTTSDTLPQPAPHPLLQHRAVWLLAGRSPAWLAAARQFVATPRGPLMHWRAGEHLLQVVDADALDAALLALLQQAPADFTLACEPGLLPLAQAALVQTLPNLLDPPPAHALRVSEQQFPFAALLPRLQQPEPELAAAWLDWATARDLPNAGAPAASADDWCALAAGEGEGPPATASGLQRRVSAAALALADWSASFAALFAPGELAQIFAGAEATEADGADGADSGELPAAQPAPLLQPFRPRQTEDGWTVLRPEVVSSVAGHAAAMAPNLTVEREAEAGVRHWAGRFLGPAQAGPSVEMGLYALALRGNALEARLTLHQAALRSAPEPGQALALAVHAADGLALRLRGPAGERPAGGTWTTQLRRQLSAEDSARLRVQPADSVVAELWWAPGA